MAYFIKLRLTGNKSKPDEVSVLLEKRKQLKKDKAACQSDEEIISLEKKLKDLDVTLTNISEEKNRNKVIEHFGDLNGTNGKLNKIGMWKVKKNLWCHGYEYS